MSGHTDLDILELLPMCGLSGASFDLEDSGCSQVLLGPVLFMNLFWLGAFFETKISRKTFCMFLFPICLFFQRTQSSGHKKENYVKVRSKCKDTVTLLGESPLEPALPTYLQPSSPCRSVALNEINLQ